MQYAFSDEQEQLRDAVRRFLSDCSPPTEVRRLMATEQGYDARVWRQLCQDLALAGVHVPESHGGQGFSVVELAIVMEEMGRALLCAPLLRFDGVGGNGHPERRQRRGQERTAADHLRWRTAGDVGHHRTKRPLGSRWHRTRRRQWPLARRQEPRGGRLRGRSARRRRPQRRGTVALRRGCYRRRDRAQATDGARCHPQAGAHRVQRRRRPLAGPRKRSRRGLDENATRCRHRAGQRNGRRRPAFAGVRGGVRQAASAIRTTHRLLPSREAPLRGTAVERRTGQIRRLPSRSRSGRRQRRQRRHCGARQPRQGQRRRCLRASRQRLHSDSRRHRLHVG